MTTRSFTLARLRRDREAFLNPRLPERCLAGNGPGGLIAVEVEAERDHDRAAAVDGAKGGGARPRLVEPQQGVAWTLGTCCTTPLSVGTPAGAVQRCPALTPFSPNAAVSVSQASASVPAAGAIHCIIAECWPRKCVRTTTPDVCRTPKSHFGASGYARPRQVIRWTSRRQV